MIMKSIFGVYDSHDKATAALQVLKKAGYPTNLISLIGSAQVINKQVYIKERDTSERA